MSYEPEEEAIERERRERRSVEALDTIARSLEGINQKLIGMGAALMILSAKRLEPEAENLLRRWLGVTSLRSPLVKALIADTAEWLRVSGSPRALET